MFQWQIINSHKTVLILEAAYTKFQQEDHTDYKK